MEFRIDVLGFADMQAAEGEAAMLQAAMRARGCKEDFIPNPELLQEGKVRPHGSSVALMQCYYVCQRKAAPCICLMWPCHRAGVICSYPALLANCLRVEALLFAFCPRQ